MSSELGKEYFTYIRDVLRLKKADKLILFDGKGHEYRTVIRDFYSRNVCLDIIRKETIKLPATHITLAQSLPKRSKMEMIIQKSTELGASRIVPFISSRSIPRPTGTRGHRQSDKMAQDSHRSVPDSAAGEIVPEVSEITSFDEMLEYTGQEYPPDNPVGGGASVGNQGDID